MAVRNTTVPSHPVPKTRLIYNILKAFKKNIHDTGGFKKTNSDAIFEQLKSKNIVDDLYLPYYTNLLSTLHGKGFLFRDGTSYALTEDGYLAVLKWEEDYSLENDIIHISDNENAKIKIERPLRVFLSCGERDNEYPIADWLKEKLEENPGVKVYWWHKDPLNPLSHRPVTTKLFDEIKDSDFFIGILHRRYCLPTGLYTTSVPCEDEFRCAWFRKKPIIGFREKGLNLEGMILGNMEIRLVDNSDQIIEYLQKSLDALKK